MESVWPYEQTKRLTKLRKATKLVTVDKTMLGRVQFKF
jgi:hypothetical protein